VDATHESEQWRNLPNVEERFWAKVDKTEGCWLWKLSPSSRGYGFFHYTAVKNHHKNALAHRVAYSLTHGPITPDQILDHLCFNRRCVRPSHLRIVTAKQNREHLAGAQANNQCGVRGVYFEKGAYRRKPWRARVMHNKKFVEAGQFATLEEATEAVRLKRLELFTHSDADELQAAPPG